MDKATTFGAKNSLIDSANWWELVSRGRDEQDLAYIRRAYEFAEQAHVGQTRVSGEPYFQHSLAVAAILAEMRLDHETIAAALLHDVAEDTDVSKDEIRRQFGESTARLVDGVTKMKLIQAFEQQSAPERKKQVQTESLRKMLLAMAEDIRVVLIKLADRIHNMRTLKSLSEAKQKRIARETLDIYAPLANRLGIWQIKWELEDLSLRYLQPDVYRKIARLLDERRDTRESYITDFIETLRHELEHAGIQADIAGRPKHIYSIWRKMERKDVDYEQLYDIRGVRILVDEVRDCYAALGIVHSKWQYIAGEFDDYIATPKDNNYQSIHTAVIGPEGKVVEVQIRTHDMHRQNELGVAAHWRYKEGKTEDRQFDEKITWLRQLLEWKDELVDAGDFIDQVKSDIFQGRIYIFTPKGSVVDLPQGATPLDFAYHIHTEVGHRCRGAKVNGRMVPLTYQLQNGQQVEILTVKHASPSRDWLNPHLGYLQSSRARSKVLQWFKQQDYDVNVDEGRDLLEREFKRLGLQNINHERLADKLGFRSVNELYVAIAHHEVKSTRFVAAAQEQVQPAVVDEEEVLLKRHVKRKAAKPAGIKVQGVGELMTHMAHCCAPLPGDEIAGYITRGRGVSIHRRDCRNMLRYSEHSPERIVEVSWGEAGERTYPVEIMITAFDRQGLLRDITSILANEKLNLIAVNTISETKEHLAQMRMTIEIANIEKLSQVLSKIEQLPNVMEVKRSVQ